MPCYFLYGEDTFSSRRKLEEIKSRFFDANMGDINISLLEGETLTLERLKRASCVAPFLAQKRLIIIKNFLTKGKEEIKQKVIGFLDKFPEYALIVFYEEGSPDKSSSLFKKLKSPKKAQEFAPLSQYSLVKWIENETSQRKGGIEKEASLRLVEITGPDLWRASSEIEKLISYRGGKTIKREDVDLLVKAEIHPNIFALIDALGERKIKKATSLLGQILSLGENESYVLSMIAYQFRNLLLVKDLEEAKKPLTLAGLHPYVLEKTKVQTKNFTQEQLKNIYGRILQTDINIKTGRMKPHLALDLLVSELSQ